MNTPKDDDARLAEIESGLANDDPRLAARLGVLSARLLEDRPTFPYRHVLAIALFCIVIVAILAALVIAITNSANPPPAPPTRPSTSAPAVPGTTP